MKLFRDSQSASSWLVTVQFVSEDCHLSSAFHAAGNSPPDVRRSDTGQQVYIVQVCRFEASPRWFGKSCRAGFSLCACVDLAHTGRPLVKWWCESYFSESVMHLHSKSRRTQFHDQGCCWWKWCSTSRRVNASRFLGGNHTPLSLKGSHAVGFCQVGGHSAQGKREWRFDSVEWHSP